MTTPANEAFGSGLNHAANPTRVNDSSLTQQSAMWDAAVRNTIGVPHSVLQPLASSGDGMSAQDAARRTFSGQYLGSTDGESSQSFQPEAEMKLEDQQG